MSPAPRSDQALQIQSGEALHLLDAAAAQPRPAFDPLLRACETDARPVRGGVRSLEHIS